jgi:hypothetical protein
MVKPLREGISYNHREVMDMLSDFQPSRTGWKNAFGICPTNWPGSQTNTSSGSISKSLSRVL